MTGHLGREMPPRDVILLGVSPLGSWLPARPVGVPSMRYTEL